MPKNAHIRQEPLKEVLRHHFTDKVGLIVLLVLFVAVKMYNPVPDVEAINKRRAEINKQTVQELTDCINGNRPVIVSTLNCSPWKGGKAVIEVRK